MNDFEEPQEPQEQQTIREILLDLAERSEIKQTPAAIKKASEKVLQSIYEKYQRDQTRETCETITNTIIAMTTEFAEKSDLISNAKVTGKKLEEKKLFRRDLNSLVSYFVPLLPYVGFLEGGLTFAKDAYDHWNTKSSPAESPVESNRRQSV